jgi:glycosyltransferase involved in cell wall biosynthesis
MLLPVIPQAVVVHDLHPLRFPTFWPQQYHYFRRVVPILLSRSHAIITDSESTRRDLLTFYGVESSRIHVIFPGHDQNHYKQGIDPSAVKEKYQLGSYLLYVGNLLPHKNLHRLLNAFAIVSKNFTGRLVIAGRKDPRYYPALAQEAHSLGLEERILFLDYFPASELPALYAGAEALVFPSLYEGFGLPALEAMACGTPVITSNTGSIPEVTGECAVLIDPCDVSGMANAIETLLNDPVKREKMKQKGFQQAALFSWRETATKLLKVLHSL